MTRDLTQVSLPLTLTPLLLGTSQIGTLTMRSHGVN